MVSTCLLGCQPPAIVPFPGTKKLSHADESYRQLLKNILQRALSAREQYERKIKRETERDPAEASVGAVSAAVADHQKELQLLIRDMKSLRPPRRYAELHEVFLNRFQVMNEGMVKIGKACVEGDFEKVEDAEQELNADAFKLAGKFEAIARELGYKSLEEFLNREIMK